jgi:phosphatidylglycerophosphate synthase
MKNLFGPKQYEAVITIPNIVTATGILLLVPYVVCFLTESNRWIMFGALFLAGCSDLFDGLLARLLKQKTRIGEIIDPLRDRLICGAVLANMFYLGGARIIFWITIIVAMELAVLFVNYYRGEKAGVHLTGKLRQAAHLLICGLVIISHYFRDAVFNFADFNFVFPLELALLLMALCSSAALIIYIYRLLNENRCS